MREIRTSGATRGAGELRFLPPTLPVILGCRPAALWRLFWSMTLREILDSLGPHSVGRDAAPLLDHAEADEAHILALLRKRELAR